MARASNRVLPFKPASITKAPPIEGKQTEYRIDGVRGLVLVVTPEGTGTFFFRYVIPQGKKRKFRSEKIGRRDAVSLTDARDRADELRRAVGGGADPASETQAKRTAVSFRELFEERLAKDSARAKSTLENYRIALEADVFDELGDLPADQISADQIATVLGRVEERSKSAAHKARSAIGSTYRWGVSRRKVKTNPAKGLGFTHQSKPRSRILSDDELARLWNAIGTEAGLSWQMRHILKLAMLTGQRRSEVAGALTCELRLNGANPSWRILSERMKKKNREQIVPLSTQAAELFKDALTGQMNGYVFPALFDSGSRLPHINGESVSRAMARLCERIKLKDAHTHDLRKCITTWLREHKRVSSDVVDLILHHARKGVTASHYDFATLEGPVRTALQDWADHVEAVSKKSGTGNVVKIRA
jgi:integrase